MQDLREGRRIEIRGTVQGVGFRPWVYRLAQEEGIGGRVRNDPQGVTIEAFGSGPAMEAFLRRLADSPPAAARVRHLRAQVIPAEAADAFVIVESSLAGDRRVSIPPDLATCTQCEAEVFDPADRRHRYAFTNCTACGPRFSIARDVPYDRSATTMAAFGMCPRCQAEYTAVEDRRFHAQPNACPECGPRLTLLRPSGEALPGEPMGLAAQALRDGRILAVKGIGGFHLACDATSSEVVRRLRLRKHRDEKPFAVMVRDLAAARQLGDFGDAEARLLSSPERPVVLVSRRGTGLLASEVAPGNPLLGLLLAYSPLHHLLLAEVGRPLVMTSGNLSEEPMAHRDQEALVRLGAIADLFLLHDREIESRCDDSVARVIAGAPVVFRRARGHVPRPVPLARPVARPVLAVGAQLKNTFCLAADDSATLGPHIGDLENLETLRAFEESVERLTRFLKVRPEVIGYDLHPDYLSTSYALERPEPVKVAVQHHHAHVVSAMVEHGLAGPVLGLAYDGTGYGTDGTAWGGELLLATCSGFERLASFRPLRLAGGDRAIREVWRIALAGLLDAFDGDPPLRVLRLFDSVAAAQQAVVRRMLENHINAPLARGVGRYFDALGAIGLARPLSRHEGQVALEWNLAADAAETGAYPYALDLGVTPLELDLRPMLRSAVEDMASGRGPGTVSARFHNTLVNASAEMVRLAAQRVGRLPVVLTGGCFQNARLAEGVRAALIPDFDVRLHGSVPPGDGGIALGQAVVADAVARGTA